MPPAGAAPPPRPRFLIVNGDDFGLTAGINAGIERACRQGILRSTSAMATGPALAEGVERARGLTELGFGLHLTLVGARPVCRAEAVPSLVGPDGMLLADYRAFLRRYLRGGIRPADVRREFRAQATAVVSLGAPLDHLDSHQHLHLLPGLLARALETAREHGIRWVRAPRPLPTSARRPAAERVMFGIASAWARGRVARAGLPLVTGSLGFDCAGNLTAEYLLRHVPTLPAGVTELICHPGAGDRETREQYSAWGYRWEQEAGALTDPAVRTALKQAGVQVTGFGGA